jgi:hypothetical protein
MLSYRQIRQHGSLSCGDFSGREPTNAAAGSSAGGKNTGAAGPAAGVAILFLAGHGFHFQPFLALLDTDAFAVVHAAAGTLDGLAAEHDADGHQSDNHGDNGESDQEKHHGKPRRGRRYSKNPVGTRVTEMEKKCTPFPKK